MTEAESATQYRAVFEAVPNGIAVLDREGRIVEANPAFCRLLAAQPEQLIGTKLDRFAVPKSPNGRSESDSPKGRGWTPLPLPSTLRTIDGREVELEWHADFVPGRHLCSARDVTERKRAERELRRKHDELTDFIENATIGLHSVDSDGTILWANRAELQILGYRPEEYIGHNIAEFHIDEPIIQNILERLGCREELQGYESRMRCKDGSVRHVLISSNVLWNEDRFVHTRCFTLDVTDRRLEQREAERQREWLRTTLASIGDAVIATDATGAVSFMNAVAESLTGWSQTEAVSRPLNDIFPIINEHTRARVSNPVDRVLETGVVVGLANHTLLLARDGREIAIDDSAAPIRDATGALLGVVLVFRDIGERRRLELEARRLAAIVKSSDDAIVSKNLDGVIVSWNAAAERMFGYSAMEIVGRPVELLVPPERPTEEADILAMIRQGQHIDHFETVRMRKDGTRVDVSVTISPVTDPDGVIVGASKVARDIGHEKALRDELERRVKELAAADRRKDEFLAMLAHELRNPLGAISNAVQVLQSSSAHEAIRQRAVEVLGRQAKHQAHLLNELLDVSRISRSLIELHFAEFDLVQLVRDATEDYRATLEQEQLELQITLPQLPVRVWADRTRIAQVVSNLLSNALKYTNPGGSVSVTVQEHEAARRVEIIVQDTGIGIDAELLPHVFESFTQGDRTLARSRGGLGLGLNIVKGLVELHRGDVRIASEGLGRGTTVRVVLPTFDRRIELAPPHRDRSSSPQLRVLVIEDHQDAAEMLKALLTQLGHDVEIANTGPEGIRKARENHPHVVLCDLGLPGMDGYEVAAALRMIPGGARQSLVAVTGYGQEQDRRRGREAGFQYHLVKPIQVNDLLEVLASLAKDLGV